MLIQGKYSWICSLLFLSSLVWGCGSSHRINSSEVPNQPMSNEANAATQAPLEDMGHYLVQKNDCLWNIAAKPRVYGDSFEWPLLFKANRDEIRDPDLIYPRQVLRVEKVRSSEEINHAREVAMATPKYVPHSKPRESLPVNYF